MAGKQSRAQARKRSNKSENSLRRTFDLIAIALFLAGALIIIGLTGNKLGYFNEFYNALKVLFGRGIYVAPVMFWVLATILLIGNSKLSLPHSIIGSVLFLLGLQGFLCAAEGSAIFEDPGMHGGYIGAMVRFLFNSAFGAGANIGLTALLIVGIYLIVDVPLIDALKNIFKVGKVGANAIKGSAKAVVRTKPMRAETHLNEPIYIPNLLQSEDASEKDEPSASVLDVFTRSKNRRSKAPDPEQLSIEDVNPKHYPDGFTLPPLSLLQEPTPVSKRAQTEINNKIQKLEQTLKEFGIGANVKEIATGPTVTRYEIELAPGIKVSRIVSLADNLAMSLAAIDVRVEAPIPGKSAIGVEVPNDNPQIVTFREVIDQNEFLNAAPRLIVPLGKDVAGAPRFADIAKMPHLLIGGATNSGKSVGLSALICGLLFRNTPKQVRLVLVDPKRVELTMFEGIPHLLCPVIKQVKAVPSILKAVIKEMERRYDLLDKNEARNIETFNSKVDEEEKLPYIVVIIDELADLMIQVGNEVENSICRIAQLARATGIHLVIATQRPSVDIITGDIKVNVPSRIAFAVSSQVDSRTILDMSGAERLLGRGDMLFQLMGAPKPIRVQGCWVSEAEIAALVNHWKEQGEPDYSLTPVTDDDETSKSSANDDDADDDLFLQAVKMVVMQGQASTSMLQRRLRIGYGRAARLLDIMERRGIVGPLDGPRPRDILISKSEFFELYPSALDDDFSR